MVLVPRSHDTLVLDRWVERIDSCDCKAEIHSSLAFEVGIDSSWIEWGVRKVRVSSV